MRQHVLILSAALLLCACEARFGNDAGEVAENATAEGRAEEGRLTIEAPGFNLSVAIPEGIRTRAGLEDREGIVYPGSTFGGIHVQGHGRENGRDGGGEVEMRFSSPDPIDRVAAWYRDPARAPDFRAGETRREGQGLHLEGERRDGERVAVTLTPRPGGGTDARLLLSGGR